MTKRILTTHTGSLPRPDDLVAMLEGHDQREARADPSFQARVTGSGEGTLSVTAHDPESEN